MSGSSLKLSSNVAGSGDSVHGNALRSARPRLLSTDDTLQCISCGSAMMSVARFASL